MIVIDANRAVVIPDVEVIIEVMASAIGCGGRLKIRRKEVYFGQRHTPGRLCASYFTPMTELGIMIGAPKNTSAAVRHTREAY